MLASGLVLLFQFPSRERCVTWFEWLFSPSVETQIFMIATEIYLSSPLVEVEVADIGATDLSKRHGFVLGVAVRGCAYSGWVLILGSGESQYRVLLPSS